jgi:2-amino-4-hydroxy-6-hydroxymethyldihydropteridine diphosphokinase
MFEKFTERVRKVLVLAQDEVGRFGHDYVGTEHILLGLVKEGEGVAAQALYSSNVTLDRVREQVESIVGHGEGTSRQAPFTPYAKKVLQLALREAMQLGHDYIGTEHILLGLARESEGVAARVLSNLDVDPNRVRSEVLQRLGAEPVGRAFVSLGSNLGDRLAYLKTAVTALGRGPRTRVIGTSKVYETVPVEVEEEQPHYLNCVIELECGVPAIEFLRYCQGIEATLGRERKGEKAPRTLDVDVLLFDKETIAEPDLTVPPGGIMRAFNLRGLADLDLDLYIPGQGRVEDLLARTEGGGIRTFGEAEILC